MLATNMIIVVPVRVTGMAPRPTRSPFETLKQVFDESDLKCEECGYYDEEGAWDATTDGSAVHYEHVCPSCGIRNVRTIEPR